MRPYSRHGDPQYARRPWFSSKRKTRYTSQCHRSMSTRASPKLWQIPRLTFLSGLAIQALRVAISPGTTRFDIHGSRSCDHWPDTLAPREMNLRLSQHPNDLLFRIAIPLHPDLLSTPDSATSLSQNLDQFFGGRSQQTEKKGDSSKHEISHLLPDGGPHL